ncbi:MULTISPECIES: hypothetical protein [unclassified Streptomyces]|uniref:hypothetical protein n=1 Tax=unclassified Streptomyces TaxID=2593676 RepID=UPI001F61EB97|nr:hypothetical protein [Streptomyces sp. AN091965]MCI3932125.1 hypothetical protein [Streptomyces sp. AN091965]
MESGPAIFAGAVFALFGAALLLWTGTRVAHRAPVAHGVQQTAAATLAAVAGLGALALAVWSFTRV